MVVLAGGPFGLGAPELLIILAVVVLIFGGTKLADLGGSMGKGIKEFKKNIKEEDEEEAPAKKEAAAPPVATVTTPPVAATPNNAVSALKCPSCEALNPANAKMCNQCGASLAAPVS
jgi:sec-independent protein translocase protein TatA